MPAKTTKKAVKAENSAPPKKKPSKKAQKTPKKPRSWVFNVKFHPLLMSLLAEKGKTNQEISDILGIDIATFYRWQQKPEVREAIKKAKEEPDDRVERSLFERAIGYSHPEEKVHFLSDGEVVTYQTRRHYPPDTAAAFIWLKNRRPERWRDKTEIQHTGGVVFQAPAALDDPD